MLAPKPAICGNGHAAMLRTKDVDTHLIEEKKRSEKEKIIRSKKSKMKYKH